MYEYAGNPLYNPMVNPYLNAQRPFQQHPRQEVVKVNGENGARAFPLGANSSALLLDESGVIVWLVTTDGAGYKTVAPFDISPHEAAPAPDFTDLEQRISALERMMKDVTTSGNSTNAQRAEYTAFTESAARTASADDFNVEKRREPSGSYAADASAKQSSYVAGAGIYQAERRESEGRL